ncbi:MAG: PH domain-containing protein [Candidatus Eisenbacteria bacterium]
METAQLKPSPKYRSKMFMVGGIVYGIIAAGILIFVLAIMAANDVGPSDTRAIIFLGVFVLCSIVTWILFAALIPPYFRSISYELTGSEIVVRKGIVTKVVKTIPYRTVTNIVEVRDLLDRHAVNLGAIKIQTAGKSGETGYEASLAGLGDWENVHQMVLDRLRGFRGAMKPTASETDADPGSAGLLGEMLDELRAIRASLTKDS